MITGHYTVKARNTGIDSANAIHHDDVARDYGFRGGLVPGVDVYGYMVPAVLSGWGESWLDHGAISVRFRKPVYDGDEVIVEGRADNTIVVVNRSADICAIAVATPDHDKPAPGIALYPRTALKDPVPADAIKTLGSIETTLEEPVDPLDVYRHKRFANPAHLLHTCNRILASNIQLGPWIHAQSDCTHFESARWGERIETRGRVASLYEKKGHKFVDLDLLITGEGERPLMHVRHVAIYEPARIRA